MPTEVCAICEATVSFDDTVHVMLNATYRDGVEDDYVCRSCYEEHLESLFA